MGSRIQPDLRRAARIRAFEDDVIGLFIDVVSKFGLPPSIGQIYGLLYASPVPLSFSSIQTRLNLSKGSISQGLRALREIGAVHTVPAATEKREHFVADTELRALFSRFLRESVQPQLRRGAQVLEIIEKEHRVLLEGGDEQARILSVRLQKIKAWHRKGSKVVPIVAGIF